MRLYHMPPSRSNRILWLLEEIGEPYDLTVITREEKEGPEHRARHPLGRVPVIEDDDGYLFESLAIALHLADLHPGAGLNFASGTHERALVYQWCAFGLAELEGPLVALFLTGGEGEGAEKARARLVAALPALEHALQGREYLVGDRLTVADVMTAFTLRVVRRREVVPLSAPLEEYLDRMEARPAYKRAEEIGAPTNV